MDAETCVKKLSYIGVLYFATVDEYGAPQVRNISAIHYEPDALYFFTARGKEFCRQHCLHCGNCFRICRVKAVVKLGKSGGNV